MKQIKIKKEEILKNIFTSIVQEIAKVSERIDNLEKYVQLNVGSKEMPNYV